MFSSKSHCIVFKLYLGITASTSRSSFTCILFILVIQLVTGAQFSIFNFLLTLCAAALMTVVFWITTVPLTCTYALL